MKANKENNNVENTTTEKITDPRQIIEDIKNNTDKYAAQYPITSENKTEDNEIIDKSIQVIKQLANAEQVTFDHAYIGTSALLQSGAYLRSVSNRVITIDKHEFTKKTLLYASEKCRNTYTLRAIARAHRDAIAAISKTYNIPGHLFAQYKIENPNFISDNDATTIAQTAAYCTDFQIDNPNAPQKVREFLANRQKNRKTKK